ncbi:MAG: HAMP domain-containing sensor histidine kinase [Myxococcota bacterium]
MDHRDARRLARDERREERREARDARRGRKRREPLSPDERRLRDARRRAGRRAGFYTHFIAFATTLALLVVATRSARVVAIVAAGWGIGVALHYFGAILAPRLRQRWIDDELQRSAPSRVDAQRRRVEQEKVRSLEELSASIAHEIRNPITAAKSLVAQMGEDPTSGENVEYARVALGELDRVERSISHLLRYARDEELRVEVVDVAGLVRSALETFRDRIARDGVRVDVDVDAAGFVRGDADKLRRAVINLVANALDAMGDDDGARSPVLSVSAGENLAGTEAWVRVRDSGPGMSGSTLERVFDPFFTTKDSGTGLGLALARKLVEAHGGSLEAVSEPGVGSEFVLVLPRDPDPSDHARTTTGGRR